MNPEDMSLEDLDRAHLIHPITEFRAHEQKGPAIVVGGEGIRIHTAAGETLIDGCSGLWPRVSFNATAGQTYYIRVNGFNAVEIDYMLTLTGPACDPGGVTGDINGDGTVDVADLLILLSAWGPCTGPCPAY